MKAPESIVCVACGGNCKLLINPESEVEPGDVVAYRCLECMDRWDLVMEEEGIDHERFWKRASTRTTRNCSEGYFGVAKRTKLRF